MARSCFFCSKKPVFGNKISHSNIKTRTRYLPNLKNVRHMTANGPKTVYSCSRCIRSGKVMKPAVRTRAAAAAV